MDETTFKILETLSRDLSSETSINSLTERVEESHGSAYYANVYNKLKQLERDNIVTLHKVGNTTVVSLNFKDYWIVDILTQVELMKKQRFLGEHIELQIVFRHILDITDRLWEVYRKNFESSTEGPPFIRSISAIRPEKNEMLNRLELLILVKDQGPERIHTMLARYLTEVLQRPMKIDALILTETKFLEMLSSNEANPAKEMFSDKITFISPQNFWHAVRVAAEKGIRIKIEEKETIPVKISEQDLVYNMARFGYKEVGTKISEGKDICLEYVIAAMITQGDARRVEAVPILLSKNTANYDILIFLSQKFKFAERLSGLLNVLAELTPKLTRRLDVQYAVRALQDMKIKPILADKESIMEKMRLYNAT